MQSSSSWILYLKFRRIGRYWKGKISPLTRSTLNWQRPSKSTHLYPELISPLLRKCKRLIVIVRKRKSKSMFKRLIGLVKLIYLISRRTLTRWITLNSRRPGHSWKVWTTVYILQIIQVKSLNNKLCWAIPRT